MSSKNHVLLLSLMISSIFLLLLFQFFWIRSEYRSAEDSFKKETNLVFKNTISGLLDSLFMARIDYLQGTDSIITVSSNAFKRTDFDENHSLASLGKALELDLQKTTIIVSADSSQQSSKDMQKKLRQVKSFMIRVNPDSLKKSSIKDKYISNLAEINREVPFRIISRTRGNLTSGDTSFVTQFISLSPGSPYQYAASFDNVRLMLLKEITPQLIFSIFLTLITMGAFIFLYRNLQLHRKLVIQKDDFINNVTHELKTPIATVNVALEAFDNFNVLENPKLRKEYLEIVKAELERLSAMADKILDTSMYDTRGINGMQEYMNMKDLVLKVVKTVSISWRELGITLEEKIEGAHFIIRGSELHLTNLLHNLLDNAAKYSNRPGQVSVQLKDEGEYLVLKVKDRGIGIPAEYQKKIFDKFFRVPQGDIHNVKGHGLGLDYVKKVVLAHKGEISLNSKEGEGSVFTIRLPRE